MLFSVFYFVENRNFFQFLKINSPFLLSPFCLLKWTFFIKLVFANRLSLIINSVIVLLIFPLLTNEKKNFQFSLFISIEIERVRKRRKKNKINERLNKKSRTSLTMKKRENLTLFLPVFNMSCWYCAMKKTRKSIWNGRGVR